MMPASADFDPSALGEGPDGYVIDRPMSPRAAIEPLALAYAFDASEDGAIMRFRPRGGAPVAELTEDDLVLPEDAAPLRLTRAQETELPREVSIGFTDAGADYRRSAVTLAPPRRRRRARRARRSRASSPTTPRWSGAPKSGCRICGRAARAPNSRCRRARSRSRRAT